LAEFADNLAEFFREIAGKNIQTHYHGEIVGKNQKLPHFTD
jgi:hypothetical protein